MMFHTVHMMVNMKFESSSGFLASSEEGLVRAVTELIEMLSWGSAALKNAHWLCIEKLPSGLIRA